MGSSSGNSIKQTLVEKKGKRRRNHISLLLKSDLCYYCYALCCEESFFVILLSSGYEQILILHAFINNLRYLRVKRLTYDKMKIKYIDIAKEQQLA